jgi:hypothetical protein
MLHGMTDTGSALRQMAWHKWLVIGVSGGVTLAIIVDLIMAAVTWYLSRPARWNTNAVSEIWSEAHEYVMQKDGEFRHGGFSLNYALQNNTGQDITIPVNAKIMQRLTNGGVLTAYSHVAKLDAATFLPAHQRAQLSVNMQYGCDTEDVETGKILEKGDPERCLARAFADSDGLVLFDYDNHLEIALSKPFLTKPKR